MSDSKPVVTRFAPSPTGPLHIGGARTALYNYLFARANGGKFLIRMEDTDRERSRREFEREILDSLAWMGMSWDGDPLYQSQRTEAYQKTVEQMLVEGKAYKDYTPADKLEEMRKEAQANKQPFLFREEMGTPEPPSEDAPFVIRFRFPSEGKVGFDDAVTGPVEAPAQQFDDLILVRSDGNPVFHLCNVLDDIHQGVTHVIRGNDHQTNTFKHVALYDALGAPRPVFAHIPLIAGPDGKKLSKRDAARSTLEYKEQGYLPEALVNFLARIGWGYGDEEVFSMEDLLNKFGLEGVGKSMGAFNPEKLDWLNQHWMAKADDARLAALMSEHLRHEPGLSIPPDDHLARIVAAQKERNKTVREMAEASWYFFKRPKEYDAKARQKFLGAESLELLAEYAKLLEALASFDAQVLEDLTNDFLEKKELKLGKIAQPLRVALTGGPVSPGIYDVMELLGKDEVLARLQQAQDLGSAA
ncbi:MAG: glutamate--tRNA ligase [Chrysiogenetes bacterium]|nr:glutamate--tRNA ligase [Chrysiogenetes bacterium]